MPRTRLSLHVGILEHRKNLLITARQVIEDKILWTISCEFLFFRLIHFEMIFFLLFLNRDFWLFLFLKNALENPTESKFVRGEIRLFFYFIIKIWWTKKIDFLWNLYLTLKRLQSLGFERLIWWLQLTFFVLALN